MSSPLYNEATATMETLAVLKAWAEVGFCWYSKDLSRSCPPSRLMISVLVLQVYIVAVHRSRTTKTCGRSADLSASALANDSSESESGGAGLLNLVQSELSTLSRLWLAALQDYALLSLPPESTSQLPATGELPGAVMGKAPKSPASDRCRLLIIQEAVFTQQRL